MKNFLAVFITLAIFTSLIPVSANAMVENYVVVSDVLYWQSGKVATNANISGDIDIQFYNGEAKAENSDLADSVVITIEDISIITNNGDETYNNVPPVSPGNVAGIRSTLDTTLVVKGNNHIQVEGKSECIEAVDKSLKIEGEGTLDLSGSDSAAVVAKGITITGDIDFNIHDLTAGIDTEEAPLNFEGDCDIDINMDYNLVMANGVNFNLEKDGKVHIFSKDTGDDVFNTCLISFGKDSITFADGFEVTCPENSTFGEEEVDTDLCGTFICDADGNKATEITVEAIVEDTSVNKKTTNKTEEEVEEDVTMVSPKTGETNTIFFVLALFVISMAVAVVTKKRAK